MQEMRRWQAVLWVTLCVLACGSSKNHHADPSGGSGAGGDEDRGGTEEVAGAPTETGSAGGVGGAAENEVAMEAIAEIECDGYSSEFDEKNIYYTCRTLEGDEFSTPKETFVLSALRIGETTPTLLATSDKPLTWLADDASWHYLREYRSSEPASDWYIRRIEKGTTALTPFAPGGTILLQTDDRVLIVKDSYYSSGTRSTLRLYDKVDGSDVVVLSMVEGVVPVAWLDGDELRWVVSPLNAAASVYAAPLSGGQVRILGKLPELCDGFQHFAGDELVALCGAANDLVRVNLNGEATVLVRGATDLKSGGLYVRDRLYWTVGGYSAGSATSLRAIDAEGLEASLALSPFLAAVTTDHGYITNSKDGLLKVKRFALADVK
jgi:hypothetical protein